MVRPDLLICLLLLIGCDGGGGSTGSPPITDALDISLRESAMWDGAVLVRRNQTRTQVDALVNFKNHDNHQETAHSVKIPPEAKVEVGWMETDWLIEPNESIGVSDPLDRSEVTYRTYRTDEGGVGFREETMWD